MFQEKDQSAINMKNQKTNQPDGLSKDLTLGLVDLDCRF